MTVQRRILRGTAFLLMAVFAVMCLYPLVWLILGSFKSNQELYTNTWGLPESLGLVNYINAISKADIVHSYISSVVITVAAVFITVFLGAMVSYGISRLHFKLCKPVNTLFAMGMRLSDYIVRVPIYCNLPGLLHRN